MTTVPVKVREWTTFDDVRAWMDGSGPVTFQITRSSCFCIGVEGAALGALHGLRYAERPIVVECRWEVNPNDLSTFDFFESLFGLALVRACAALHTPSGVDVREPVLKGVWQRTYNARGRLGAGSRVYVVSRDPDVPLPVLLAPAAARFPERTAVRAAITKLAQEMGWPQQMSRSGEPVLTFLYEAIHNAHEHGRTEWDSQGAERAVVGIRGLILEKVIFQPDSTPRALTDDQLPYFEHIRAERLRAPMLLALTVVDLGPGIHRTLPRLDGESDWAAFLRAFDAGVSRKQRSGDVDVGLGLAHLHAAATALHAWLMVRSADLVGTRDFAVPSSGSVLDRSPIATSPAWRGTSLTIVWPAIAGGGDQPSLFG